MDGVKFDPAKDNEKAVDERLRPLLQQILDICKEEGIAFVAVAQFSEDGFATTAHLNGPYDPFLAHIVANTCPEMVERALREMASPSN